MLQSCQSYPIDLILAVDGRYDTYPTKSEFSSQKVIDLFKGFQTPYNLYAESNLNQNEKRQIYMDACEENDLDCLIVMDSDEYFITDRTNWSLFIDDLSQKIQDNAHTYKQAYCIPVTLGHKGIEKMPEGYTENLPRLFYHPWQLQYVDDHFSIRSKKTGVLMTFEGNATLEHIAIGHDHELRTKQYTKNTTQYEEELIQYENSVRAQRQQRFSEEVYKRNHPPSLTI